MSRSKVWATYILNGCLPSLDTGTRKTEIQINPWMWLRTQTMLIVVDAQRVKDRLLFTTYDYTFRFHVVLWIKLAKPFLLLSMCFFPYDIYRVVAGCVAFKSRFLIVSHSQIRFVITTAVPLFPAQQRLMSCTFVLPSLPDPLHTLQPFEHCKSCPSDRNFVQKLRYDATS